MFPRPRYLFLHDFLGDDSGMSTVEYTVGIIAAVSMAVILLGVIKGGSVEDGIASLIERALDVKT